MNPGTRRLWIGVVVVAVALTAGFFWTRREPRFEGRSASEWLDAYAATETRPGAWVDRMRGPRKLRDSHTGRPLKDPELEAFVSMGPAAVPVLTRHVRTGFLDSDRYVQMLAKLPSGVVDLLPRPWDRATRRFLATEILLSLGSDARSALPALVQLLDSTEPSAFGPMTMGIPVGARVPARVFVPVLRDRERLVEAVCRICGDRGELEPLLLELGRRGRFRCLVELAAAGGWQGAELSRLLAEALGDPRPEVRAAALRLLETAPEPGPAVSSRVVRALKDPDDTVRWLAARTLEASGSRAPEVVAALHQATGDTNRMVQTVARRTLEKLARDPSEPAEAR